MAAVPTFLSWGLVPFRAATWAGPSGASTSDQRRRAERTDYIRSGRDRRKPLAQGWLFLGNRQVNQKRNCARKRDKSEAPVKGRRVRIDRGGPKAERNQDKADQADPLEGPARLGIGVGIAIAHAALPVLPEADREDRDPEDVPDIESAYRDGSAGRLAAEAIVVAKANFLRPEMVGAIDDEHGGARGCCILPHYLSGG